MRKFSLLMALALCFALQGCVENALREEFIQTGDQLGLQVGQTKVFEYDAATCQYSYLPDSKEFRVGDDAMNNYFILKLSNIPQLNSETGGTLIYTTESSIVTKNNLKFKLVKVEESAKGKMLWFWNSKSQYGAVVMEI